MLKQLTKNKEFPTTQNYALSNDINRISYADLNTNPIINLQKISIISSRLKLQPI